MIKIIKKLKWFIKHEGFTTQKVRKIFRLILWELYSLFNIKLKKIFDKDLIVFLYPGDGVARLTYYFDYHEPQIFKFLDTYLKSGMTYIDVGANIGLYSLYASKRIGDSKVYAFEPQPEIYKKALENININNIKNIAIENYGLGSKNLTMNMILEKDSAKAHIDNHTNLTKSQGIIEVEVIRFDDYATSHNITSIDYLKIDVEGYEYEVLLGMSYTLDKIKPKIIQIELYEDFLRRNDSSVNMVIMLLAKYGYHPNYLVNNKLISVNTHKISGDIFFIREQENV